MRINCIYNGVYVQFFEKCFLRYSADHAVYFLAVLEEDDGRNGHDVELSCEFLHFIGINFGEVDFISEQLGGMVHDRGHHAAGAAPSCPEVNNAVTFVVYNFSFEICLVVNFCDHKSIAPFRPRFKKQRCI